MPITKGAQIAIKAVAMGAQVALTAMNRIEGPRLDNLDVTTAEYGTLIDYFWALRRLEGRPIIWAEKLREKKTTSKTKGGKYSEYKYFGTFAVLIAGHPIDSVTRIWMDKHLVYDVTKAGPIAGVLGLFSGLGNSPVKLARGRNMRIYDGTQTEPDPRMEEWCEDRYGPDSCPAYKGYSYIVFEELPLEKFGNRIPQVTVEAVNNDADNFLFETITPGASLGPWFSPDGSRALWHNSINTEYVIWDVPTRTKIVEANLPASCDEVIIGADGNIYGVGGTLGAETLRIFSPDGHTHSLDVDIGTFGDRLTSLGTNLYLRPYSGAGTSIIRCTASGCIIIDVDFTPEMFFEDLDGGHWAVALSGTDVILYDIGTGSRFTVATPGGVTGPCSAMVNDDGDFFVVVDTVAMIVDFSTGTLVESVDIGGDAADHFEVMRRMRAGSPSFFGRTREVDTNTLETVQTYSLASWTASDIDIQAYEPITHSLWSRSGTIRYLDRVTSGGVTLATVVEDVAGWCGLDDPDTTDLDQVIKGYSVTQGSGKDMIAPLLDIHDCDAAPHDFTIRFIKRGRAVSGTIETSEFVREGDEPRYTVTIAQDTDLPRRISLNFADSDKDQQTNTVVAQRPLDAMDGDREQQIDLTTYLATPGEAQKFVDRYFRRQWNEREGIGLALTSQYLGAEPGDTFNLSLDGVERFARLVKWTLSQGRINTEWKRDALSFNTLSSGSGSELDARDDDELYIAAPTKGFVVDIPLLTDSDSSSSPLLYYCAGDYSTGTWPGAGIYRLDAGAYEPWNTVDSSDNATWGYAHGALGDANPNLWDRGNELTVDVKGDLTSCTEADIEADPSLNLALLGDELINFTTATLNGDGTYTLSGFKRGRRGTEWACGSHAAGDEFILAAYLQNDEMGLSDVDLDFTFKAQSLLRELEGAVPIEVAFTGASLKPYAPARVRWSTDGTDLTGEIIRRTRVGGSWSASGTVPVSENSEAYEIDVYVGAAFKRTLSVTGTNSFTYTAAHMVADGTSLSSRPTFNVYQMSDAVGRGFALAA